MRVAVAKLFVAISDGIGGESKIGRNHGAHDGLAAEGVTQSKKNGVCSEDVTRFMAG